MFHRSTLICIVVALFSFPEYGWTQDESPDVYVIANVRVYDVQNGVLNQEPQSLLVSGNRIQQIGDSTIHQNHPVLDAGGRVVMPGLIDLHSHLLLHPYNEATWNEQVLNESLELRTIRGTVAARKTLEAGFTTIRDLGTEGAGYADVALRDAIEQAIIPGPRVFTATRALVTTGGYGPMGFDPRWKMPVGAQVADGVAECRRVTREQIAAGADWIKVYADYRRRPGDASTPTFSQDELNAIVDEATSAGVPVSAHATTDEGIRRAVEAGVITIEHGYDASLEVLGLMRQNGVVLCPTLAASEAMAIYSGWKADSDAEHPRITTAKKLIRDALNIGVIIACGSDVGVFPHGHNVREMELMYAWGMPVEDVIRGATLIAALVLQQQDLGQVREDYIADLIVVENDPAVDFSTLRRPLLVIRNGTIVVNRLSDSTSGAEADITMKPPEARETVQESSVKPDAATSHRQETAVDENRRMESIDIDDADSAVGIEFRINVDGSYSFEGKAITIEQLAAKVQAQVDNGHAAVRLMVPRALSYQDLAETQAWLRRLHVDAVFLSIIDD